jgi:hypothetical protein
LSTDTDVRHELQEQELAKEEERGGDADINQTTSVAAQSSQVANRAQGIVACHVDADVLHGVRANKILARFGFQMRNNIGSAETYDLSEQCEMIDQFWSHSWRANSRQKIINLYYHYNSLPAFILSFIAVLLAMVLVNIGVFPGQSCFKAGCESHGDCSIHNNTKSDFIAEEDGYCAYSPTTGNRCLHHSFCCARAVDGVTPIEAERLDLTDAAEREKFCPAGCPQARNFRQVPFFVGTVVFLLTFFFWQPRSLIFLDKVCIHQTDMEKKARGIDGLGGFLRKSRQMLLLWDPSYFTRLWCTFEVAAISHLVGSDANICVAPIRRGYIAAWTTLNMWIINLWLVFFS